MMKSTAIFVDPKNVCENLRVKPYNKKSMALPVASVICKLRPYIHGNNDFAEVSKYLVRNKSENNFVRSSN